MKKKWISLVLSVFLTVVLLAVLFFNISPSEVLEALSAVSLHFVLLAAVAHLFAYLMRNLLLSLFFRDVNSLGYWYLLCIHFIHNFYVHIVPASLGELSYPILLKKHISINKSLSVIVIVRLITMLVLFAFFVIAVFILFDINSDIGLQSGKLIVAALLFLATVVILIFYKTWLRYLQKIAFFERLIHKISNFLQRLKAEGYKLRKAPFALEALLYSILNIMALAVFYIFILRGIGLRLSVFEVLFVSSINITMMILPIKSIGGFGTTEGAWTLGLILLGIDKTLAIQAAFAIHIFGLINVIVLFGLGFLGRWLIVKKQTHEFLKTTIQ